MHWQQRLKMMNLRRWSSFVSTFVAVFCLTLAVEVHKPRGVSLTKKSFYDPSKNFACLDGSLVLPFHYVNDDFCDCRDGTDEPGTAACPNGFFHCSNVGHRPLNIPSSRVNDGICDCCDASDEYNTSAQCVNSCRELGRKAREDAQRQVEIANKGYQAKLELSKEGKARKDEKKQRLEELEKQKVEADIIKSEKEEIKKAAEELEKAALDKHKEMEDKKKEAGEELERQKKDRQDSLEAFVDLDVNGDSKITVDEIQHKWVFDTDKDGIVTVEEAKFLLNNKLEMTRAEFFNVGWMLMKPHYSQLKLFENPPPPADDGEAVTDEVAGGESESAGQAEAEAPVLAKGYAEEDDEEDDDDFDEERDDAPTGQDDEEEGKEGGEVEQGGEPAPPAQAQYDEETQQLVNDANAFRAQFDEAKKIADNLDDEIRELKKYLELDLGEENQFAPLHHQCLEYTDREYTYKLCLFDQSTQRPKTGGSEINLGTWDKWNGPEDNKYAIMQYSNGLGCWSGPNRATEVRVSCGTEHRIVSVAEPNRCIYVFELETPSVCRSPGSDPTTTHGHEEL